MTVNFALRFGGTHDPEGDCRETEASIQGRLQGPPLQGVADPAGRRWYLRYPLSYRDIEELFVERGLAVDHATADQHGLLRKRGFMRGRRRKIAISLAILSLTNPLALL